MVRCGAGAVGVRRRVAVAMIAVSALMLAGCSTGDDAVAQGGTFDFVSPGGKTDIFYDPPQDRGTVGNISGPDLMTDGKTTAVSDYPGKVVVINLWGSWCAPCRTESPQLERAYEATKGLGVQFLGIDVRDTRDAARDFVIDAKVTYPGWELFIGWLRSEFVSNVVLPI